MSIDSLLWKALQLSGFNSGVVLSAGISVLDAPQDARIALVEPDGTAAGTLSAENPGLAVHAKTFVGQGLPVGQAAAFVGSITDAEQVSDALELVALGGYLIACCPPLLLDSHKTRLRRILAAKSDLISAIRIPLSEPVDLIILRKREHSATRSPEQNGSWVPLVSVLGSKNGKTANQWFVEHPDSLLAPKLTFEKTAERILEQDLKTARVNGLRLDTHEPLNKPRDIVGLLDRGLHLPSLNVQPRYGQLRAALGQNGLEVFGDGRWTPVKLEKVGIKAKTAENLDLVSIKEVARKLQDCRDYQLSPLITEQALCRELGTMLDDYEAKYGTVDRFAEMPTSEPSQRQIDSYIRSQTHRWRISLGEEAETTREVPSDLLAQWFEHVLTAPRKAVREHLELLANDPDLELLLGARSLA